MGKETWQHFHVRDIGSKDIILGLPWFKRVNPKIDFTHSTIKIKQALTWLPRTTVKAVPEEESTIHMDQSDPEPTGLVISVPIGQSDPKLENLVVSTENNKEEDD